MDNSYVEHETKKCFKAVARINTQIHYLYKEVEELERTLSRLLEATKVTPE